MTGVQTCALPILLWNTLGNSGDLNQLTNASVAFALASLLPSGAGLVAGVLIVCYGQQVQCFVDIEENTRETNRLLVAHPKLGPTPQIPTPAPKPVTPGSIRGLSANEAQSEEEVKRLVAEMKARGEGPRT